MHGENVHRRPVRRRARYAWGNASHGIGKSKNTASTLLRSATPNPSVYALHRVTVIMSPMPFLANSVLRSAHTHARTRRPTHVRWRAAGRGQRGSWAAVSPGGFCTQIVKLKRVHVACRRHGAGHGSGQAPAAGAWKARSATSRTASKTRDQGRAATHQTQPPPSLAPGPA